MTVRAMSGGGDAASSVSKAADKAQGSGPDESKTPSDAASSGDAKSAVESAAAKAKGSAKDESKTPNDAASPSSEGEKPPACHIVTDYLACHHTKSGHIGQLGYSPVFEPGPLLPAPQTEQGCVSGKK